MSFFRPNIRYVELRGDPNDIDEFIHAINQNAEVLNDNGHIFVSCTGINHAGSERNAMLYVKGFVQKYKQAYQTVHTSLPNISVGAVLVMDEQGKKNQTIFVDTVRSIIKFGRARLSHLDSNDNIIPSPISPVNVIFMAYEIYPEVYRANSYLCTDDHTFLSLYKVFEIIRDDCGGEKEMILRNYCTKNELDSFKASSNHPELSGEAARHALMPGQPNMNRQISLEEGKNLMTRIFIAWVENKMRNVP